MENRGKNIKFTEITAGGERLEGHPPTTSNGRDGHFAFHTVKVALNRKLDASGLATGRATAGTTQCVGRVDCPALLFKALTENQPMTFKFRTFEMNEEGMEVETVNTLLEHARLSRFEMFTLDREEESDVALPEQMLLEVVARRITIEHLVEGTTHVFDFKES